MPMLECVVRKDYYSGWTKLTPPKQHRTKKTAGHQRRLRPARRDCAGTGGTWTVRGSGAQEDGRVHGGKADGKEKINSAV